MHVVRRLGAQRRPLRRQVWRGLYYATQRGADAARTRSGGMRMAHWLRVTVVGGLLAALLLPNSAALAFPADASFGAVWSSTDQSVAAGSAGYSWFWGPELRDQRVEAYQESPGGARDVRYYDKSRMEINDPDNDPATPYFVTNGLLTEELVTGNLQVGNAAFEQREPSAQFVAGDQVNNPGTPSYAAFAPYATTDGVAHRASDQTGQPVTQFLNGAGQLSNTDAGDVTLASYQSTTGHNIASVFWQWANAPDSGFQPEQGVDWLYVLGYPISEPYWIDSTVGGTPRRVLVQLFERRVLTYTAANSAAFQVEFGNIGLHYHDWRYGPSPIVTRASNIDSLPATDGAHVVWSAADDDTHHDIISHDHAR
jgi:hypothetical protein